MMKPTSNSEGGARNGEAKEENETKNKKGDHKGHEGASARIRTSVGHTIRIAGSIANIVIGILSIGCSIASITGSLRSIRASKATMTG